MNNNKNNYINIFIENKVFFLSIALANFLSLSAFYIESIILGFLSTDVAIANYRMASMVIMAFYFIPSTIMNALSPMLVTKSHTDSYHKVILKICLSLLVVAIPIVLVLFFGSDMIFSYFFGEKYTLAAKILPILSIGLILVFAVRVPIGNALYLAGFARVNLIIGFISLLVSSVSVYLFVGSFGVLGAAYSFVFSLFLSSVFLLIYFLSIKITRAVK